MTRHRLALSVALLFCLAGCGGGGGGGSATTQGTGNNATPVGTQPADVWTIPQQLVVDGGPGKDGTPSVDNPTYVAANSEVLSDNALVVGFLTAAGARAISHEILDWHEVVNDNIDGLPVAVNYCPLTGSAMLWEGAVAASDPTFGVSGLLYNSNLILYDRETDSLWSQMSVQSVNGQRVREQPRMRALVETTWGTWRQMYPETTLMSRVTGFSRNYGLYPYGDFRTSDRLIFSVSTNDTRLHRKARVVGVTRNGIARAYPIGELGSLSVINDELANTPLVIAGSAAGRYGVAYERRLPDGTELTFEAVADSLPVVMRDGDGGLWDVFGQAQTGPHTGETLAGVDAYVAYWFAWAAFHEGSAIHAP